MRIGIDANGRSFRWKSTGSCQVDYAIHGNLSDAEHPRMIWDNAMAGSAIVPCNTLPLERVWQAFHYAGGDSSSVDLLEGMSLDPAAQIVNAIAQLVPQVELDQNVVLAIPNQLDEDGQDAILTAFSAKRFFDSLLFWRPVAIALTWISANEQKAKQLLSGKKDLVVWDFESHCLEVTQLGWKESNGYACPVRRYPRLSDQENTPPFASYEHAVNIASHLAAKESCHSIVAGPYGPAFQSNVETNVCAPVLYQDAKDPRRWRKAPVKIDLINTAFSDLKAVISRWARKHPDKHILVHGWPARFALFEEGNIEVVQGNSVAYGCRIYAERLDKGLPTYFDSLPEYGIWAKYCREDEKDDFGFRTVVQNEVVPGNSEWKAELHGDAQTRATLESFSIPAHKNALSLFVRNRLQFEDDEIRKTENPEAYGPNGIMVAKKLTMNLPANTRDPINLSMNIAARPAAGHIRIEISERNGKLPANASPEPTVSWFGDSGRAEFSWKTAEEEPEHKGYLDAQEVVGRIMDPVTSDVALSFGISENRDLARLLVKRLEGKLTTSETKQFQAAINVFRPGTFDVEVATLPNMLKWILTPWGYTTDPKKSQPTRGLFGSRSENDPELFHIAARISDYVRKTFDQTSENWWKYQNYLFVYASDEFKEDVRDSIVRISKGQLKTHYTFSEFYSPGRIFSSADDLSLQMSLSRSAPNIHRFIQYWSFFRSLCYHHKTARVPLPIVENYMSKICSYFSAKTGSADERKYGAHAILFALRLREFAPSFLALDSELQNALTSLLETGPLNTLNYPPSMLAGMKDMVDPDDNFSKFVWRFLNYQDTLKDREIGAGLATS